MATVIDMQQMRYINLFSKISGVEPSSSFMYNGQLFFLVPSSAVSKAIGKDAANVKKIGNIVCKKIRIVATPKKGDDKQIINFVQSLIEPVEVGKIEVVSSNVEISATRMVKAGLIGRNRIKEKQLIKILKDVLDVGLIWKSF